jgi:hypothetical protein
LHMNLSLCYDRKDFYSSFLSIFGGKVKNKKIIVFLAVIVFLVQAACAVGGTTATTQAPVAPTQDIGDQVATGIALTQAAQQVVAPPVNTLAPLQVLPTTTPEVPTFTVAPSVQGSVNYGANCRSGPGANFPNLLVYEQGTLVNVIGTSMATDKTIWWQVSSSGQADCWLIDAAVTISGDKSSVAKVVSPPTPTPVPPPYWGGTWVYWIRGGFSGAADETGNINMIQSGNSLTATFYEWGYAFTINGTISADGMAVNGTMSRGDGGKWTFVLKRNPSNLNQFRGSWYIVGNTSWDGDWCGAINGAGKPSPCKSN